MMICKSVLNREFDAQSLDRYVCEKSYSFVDGAILKRKPFKSFIPLVVFDSPVGQIVDISKLVHWEAYYELFGHSRQQLDGIVVKDAVWRLVYVLAHGHSHCNVLSHVLHQLRLQSSVCVNLT